MTTTDAQAVPVDQRIAELKALVAYYRDVAIMATSLAALFLLVIAALSVVVVVG